MKKLIPLVCMIALAGCAGQGAPQMSVDPQAFNAMGDMGMRLMAAGGRLTPAQRAAALSGLPMPATQSYAAPMTPMAMQRPIQTNCGPNGNTIQCTTF
jgi:hypothetical protein